MILRASSQEEPTPVPMGADVAAPSILLTAADGAALSPEDRSLSSDASCLAPAGTSGASAPAPDTLSIELTAAVALILKLITDAKSISPDEAIARGICIYADHIGIPTLARPIDASTELSTGGDDDFRDGEK